MAEPTTEPGRRARRPRAFSRRLDRLARRLVVRIADRWLDFAIGRASRDARGRTREIPPGPGDPPRTIRFLLMHAWGVGGTIRSTFNTASYLAPRHDVEIVSIFRNRDTHGIAVPEGLRIRWLFDRREQHGGALGFVARALQTAPSRLWLREDATYQRASRWTDVLLLRWLCAQPPGTVVIATRPALVAAASRLAPRGVIVIGQEHQRLGHHKPALRAALAAAVPNVSLIVTLTDRDRADYAVLVPDGGPPLVTIPNAVPDVAFGPGDPDAHRVLAAGRLVRDKGYDLLLRAFAVVAPRYPDWTLDIFGVGWQLPTLQRLARELGLDGRVQFRQPTKRLGEEMRRASVYVLSSRSEGFPLVLLEAMSAGLAAVAFDCPTGPREIVDDGATGLLVPANDVAAFAAALDRVLGDPALRRRLAAAAPAGVEPYRLAAVGRRWDAVLGPGGAFMSGPGPAAGPTAGTTTEPVSRRRRASRSRPASSGSPRACAAGDRRRPGAPREPGRDSAVSCRPGAPARAQTPGAPSGR